MQIFKTLSCLLVVTLLVSSVSFSQKISRPGAGAPGTWKLLGTVDAQHTADHDVIVVAGPHDYFRQLKFKVTNSPLNMQRMVVTYDDGGLPENINIRFNIPQGGESRVIDLKGGKRKLKAVHFWYDTKGFLKGRADVTLFGIK